MMYRYSTYRQPSLRILGNMIACTNNDIAQVLCLSGVVPAL